MTDPTVLHLPWCPSVNSYWRAFKGRKILSKEARVYRAAVIEAMLDQVIEIPFADERLKVRLDFYPPDRRKRDLDNLPKGVLDSLMYAAVYEDDSQIDDLRLVRHPSEGKPGRIEVTLQVIKGA